MGLVRGSQWVVWGGLAALLCAGLANHDRDGKAALARLGAPDIRAALAAAPAGSDLRPERSDPDAPDPLENISLAKPEVEVNPQAADECLLAQDCVDQYLWLVYDRAPKVDTNKLKERIKATVKSKGKTRTVMKTVIRLVDGDFTWKDPKAAERAGMSLKDYVIGGMDRAFKGRLYRLFRALDEAGLAPGMTSGFRDDYRQSIATGNKAASDSSYHGGSRRGGYGRGLAADIVSVKGETRSERWRSTEMLWSWVDAHGKEFGIGRPYLDKDPPHIAPIDGKEYVAHRGVNAKTKHAGL